MKPQALKTLLQLLIPFFKAVRESDRPTAERLARGLGNQLLQWALDYNVDPETLEQFFPALDVWEACQAAAQNQTEEPKHGPGEDCSVTGS